MKRHEVSYHEYDDSIFFRFEFCNHLKASNHSFSNRSLQKTKKESFFSKKKLSDQSKIEMQDVQNKELLIFFKKINNSKRILKRSTLKQIVKSIIRTLNESSKTLNERRRINEF